MDYNKKYTFYTTFKRTAFNFRVSLTADFFFNNKLI